MRQENILYDGRFTIPTFAEVLALAWWTQYSVPGLRTPDDVRPDAALGGKLSDRAVRRRGSAARQAARHAERASRSTAWTCARSCGGRPPRLVGQ